MITLKPSTDKKYIKTPEARRRHTLMHRYGITVDEYDKMLESQGGGCAICGVESSFRKLDIDHCHETGKVRGILCTLCNNAIGRLNDDPELLRSAIEYLENSSGGTTQVNTIDRR